MVDVLNRLSDTDCIALCHGVVDGLCGRPCPRQVDYSDTWSPREWLHLLRSLTTIFRLAGGGVSDEEVLVRLEGSRHAKAVLGVLRGRQEEIRRALLERTAAVSSAVLQDFDWQLKLALSSDKISCLNAPLLRLHLDLSPWRRPVAMEMTRDELSMLIASLEAANKVVLQLK